METLVVRIPESLAREIEAEAEQKNLSKSEVARQRLSTPGISQDDENSSGFGLIKDLIGSVKGGPSDMSSRKKHHLKKSGYGKR